jgi:hypothetical protein
VGSERGLLASTAQDWSRSLLHLIDHGDERAEQGRLAREFVEREYSYDRWAPEWAALLRGLAEG